MTQQQGRPARRPVRVPKKAALLWAAVVAFFVIVYVSSETYAGALLFGIAAGALVAAIALGVVLTYKGSGVVNFASGAIAMFAAYVYMDLRTKGELFLPPLPAISLGQRWSFFPALVVSLLVSSLLGLLLHLLVFRPLRKAPALARVVASVGVLVLLQAIVILRFGTTPISLPPELPKDGIGLPRGITIPADQVIAVAIVLVLAIVLWAVFKYTRFGIATRANAENEKSVVLLGHAPSRLAAANWVLSSMLVGLMGVLVSTINSSVDPNTITLLIVPALAAALLGNFTSFGVTVAAGVAISMGEALTLQWSLEDWFPHVSGSPLPGIENLLPLVVIIAVLIARGTAIPTRATATALRMPSVARAGSGPTIAVKMLGLLVLATVLLLSAGPEWRLGVMGTASTAVLAMSLVVLTGLVGQISFAQLALAGGAGFMLSKVTLDHGLPFPLGPLVAILFATVIGIVVSLVSIRVRGVDLAIVTLALAVIAETVIFNNPTLAGSNFGATVPPPRLAGAHFGPGDPTSWSLVGYSGDGKIPNPWFGVFCVIVALLMGLVVLNFRRSRSGRLSLAVRSNERATASAGVSVTRVKMVAFSLGAFLAGVGGVLAGYSAGSVASSTFGAFASLTLLVYAYLGGITSVGGALTTGVISTGGLAAVALEQWFHVSNTYLLLIGGIGLLVTVVLNPEGIAGGLQRVPEQVLAGLRKRPKSAPPVPPSPAAVGHEHEHEHEHEPIADRSPAVVEEEQRSGTTA